MATSKCLHDDWQAHAVLLRDTDDDGALIKASVELTMACVACRAPMRWVGLPVGPSSFMPTVAEPAALTAVLPCEPDGAATAPSRRRRVKT